MEHHGGDTSADSGSGSDTSTDSGSGTEMSKAEMAEMIGKFDQDLKVLR